jgi:hypothetical protein
MLFQPVPPGPTLSQHLTLDVIDKLVKIAAVMIGALWAYLNYVRGRTFKKRLELTICGKTLRRGAGLLLSGSAELKNVGLSKVAIEQRGTAILIYDLKAASSLQKEPINAVEERTLVLSVFENHGWIEPGETIQQSFLLQLPETQERIGIKLELRIVAAYIEWNANSIVELGDAKAPAEQAGRDSESCGKQSTTGGRDGADVAGGTGVPKQIETSVER